MLTTEFLLYAYIKYIRHKMMCIHVYFINYENYVIETIIIFSSHTCVCSSSKRSKTTLSRAL